MNKFVSLCLLIGVMGGYIKVWDDPFTSLDNWVPEVKSGADTGNNEWEYYTSRSENVRVESRSGANVLVITAQAEEYEGYHYTSGRLHSAKEYGPYGFFNIQAQVPKGDCIWPAIWMLPAGGQSKYGTWAACGEIDIMETVCSANTKPEGYGTLHFGGEWPKNVEYPTGDRNAYPVNVDWSKPHHFGMEWQPGFIKFWLDADVVGGQVVGTLLDTITSDKWYAQNGEGQRYTGDAPFDVPFGIILNVAIGGAWPTAIGGCCDQVEVPAEMVVYKVEIWEETQLQEI